MAADIDLSPVVYRCVACGEELGHNPKEAREHGYLIHAERYETDRHGWQCKDCCGVFTDADVATCETCSDWFFRGEGYGEITSERDEDGRPIESREIYCSEFCRGDATDAEDNLRALNSEYRRSR
jgi:hypothetical protein